MKPAAAHIEELIAANGVPISSPASKAICVNAPSGSLSRIAQRASALHRFVSLREVAMTMLSGSIGDATLRHPIIHLT